MYLLEIVVFYSLDSLLIQGQMAERAFHAAQLIFPRIVLIALVDVHQQAFAYFFITPYSFHFFVII